MTRVKKVLRDKVVVVTGGARGIGRATGLAFLRAGAKVALGDVDSAHVQRTAAELAALTGGQVCGLALDVTSRLSFAAFLDEAESHWGPADIVINNAGIMPTGLFVDEDDAMTDRMLDINLRGVIIGSKLAVDRFAGRGGHIVNIASLAAVSAYPGVATYCATKHAVLGFTEALQRELPEIGVTLVLPGVVRTELSAGNALPGWARPLAEVDAEDVADAIVAAVRDGRRKVAVPKALGVVLTVLPGRARLRLERMAHFDTAFTDVDPQARERYHLRIAARG